MFPRGMAVVALCSILMLLFSGCDSANVRSIDPPADVYLARLPQIAQKKSVDHIVNLIGGDIIVITSPGERILTDVIAHGSGNSMEDLRFEIADHINVTNDGMDIEARFVLDANGKAPPSPTSVQFHVVVPSAVNLPDIRTHAGNIEVDGNVGGVKAEISDHGNIEVRGANGAVDLKTNQGSIIADIMQGQSIKTHAADGDLDLRAVDAFVSASTTNKDIRFYGTLQAGKTHSFTTTGAGNINIAMPPYPNGHPAPQVYRFDVTTSASPVDVEYPAMGAGNASAARALAICGFIHSSGPYDYHVENTSANTGRIEVSPVITGTYFFSGTLATDYFRFDTNQTRVSFFTPVAQSIHIYTADQLNAIALGGAGKDSISPDCQAALSPDSSSAITVMMKTDSGSVYIHDMTMRND